MPFSNSQPDGVALERAKPSRLRCYYCIKEVYADQIYWVGTSSNGHRGKIVLCPECGNITMFDGDGNQYPKIENGRFEEFLPERVQRLYHEIRRVKETGSDGAVILLCQQLFLTVARDQGAEAQAQPKEGLIYLDSQDYLPDYSRPWIDQVIQIEGKIWDADDEYVAEVADASVVLAEMMLEWLYVYPGRLKGMRTAGAVVE